MTSWLRSHRWEAAAAILWLTVVLMSATMLVVASRIEYAPSEAEFSAPILALEFADQPDRVMAVVLAGGTDRRAPIRRVQQLDEYFIPAYVALFGVITGIGARYRRRAGRIVAAFAILLFGAAGAADHRENAAIDTLLASLDPMIGTTTAPDAILETARVALETSSIPASVVRAASVKWTLLFLGGGLLGFLLLARPYEPAWPRRFLASSGIVLLFGAGLGVGLWIDPRSVEPASWCLIGGMLGLFAVAALRSEALADPPPASTAERAALRPDIGKADHLLPLASVAIASLDTRTSPQLNEAFRAELRAWIDRSPPSGGEPASTGGETIAALLAKVPRTVSLTLMADLLVRFPDDALCLAARDWRERARVIDDLAREVIRLQADRERSWLERMSNMVGRSGLECECLDDVELMLEAHGVIEPRDREVRERLRLGPIRRAFLRDPDLAARVAERVGFAVPFNLALQAELAEVELSRTYRMAAPSGEGSRCDGPGTAAVSGQSAVASHPGVDERGRRQPPSITSPWSPSGGPADSAAPPADVGAAGLRALEGARLARLRAVRRGTPSAYAPKRAADLNLVGVALSGGGIRSATFNLGILQALASLGRLRYVDYLSTVSGGGYIGSWLVLWIRRICQTSSRDPSRGSPPGVIAVERALSPVASPDPNMPTARPIRFLREFSNYLTPRRGLLGADTWTAIAVWFRNTMLIQSVLVLSLAAVLLLPRALGQVEEWLALQPSHRTWFALAAGLVCFLGVSWHAGTELARFERRYRRDGQAAAPADWAPASKAGTWMAQITLILPGFLCGLFLGGALFAWTRRGGGRPDWLPLAQLDSATWGALAAGLLVLVGITVTAFRAGYAPALFLVRTPGAAGGSRERSGPRKGGTYTSDESARTWRQRAGGGLVLLLALLGPAVLSGALMYGVGRLFGWWAITIDGPTVSAGAGPFHVASFGAPIVIEVLALALVLHIGLMGRDLPDDRREWWSRLGAWLLIYTAVWIALFAVAIYGPLGVSRASTWVGAMGGLGWLGATAWGAYVAQSAKTAPATSAGTGPPPNWRDWIAVLAPYVFVVGLLVLVALANQGVTTVVERWRPDPMAIAAASPGDYWASLARGRVGITLALACAAFALAMLLAWRVDVNEFSMHHFYRNRLVRCYLGASREGQRMLRSPHPFTGFDAGDDARLATLRTDGQTVGGFTGTADDLPAEPYVGPLPIINTALNLVKGDDLAWQERRAQSFVFTPLFSGYEQVSLTPSSRQTPPALARDAMRPTWSYGYSDGGVHVGTAMSVSGAAANPNMGYHSSPAAAFLMTMFNVRLGWWLGNPRHMVTWTRSSPRLGLAYLVNELLGNTKSTSAFVNLSDGGHFENLGIYELVRRHCRLIIACDAEQDGDLTFSGLGNAIRKCRTDFGVEIEFLGPSLSAFAPSRASGPSGPQEAPGADDRRYAPAHWLEAVIRYPSGDQGRLIYIKSSLTGDEPGDVFEYSRRVRKFPHESTADQFFDESQFESYRKLGYHIGQGVFTAAFATADQLPPGAPPRPGDPPR
jgi:hypothetical protein